MKRKRIVAAKLGNGHISLIEQDVPPLRPGTVLVQVHNSLISPGTELGGWRGLRRELDEPKPLPEPLPFGYSNSGVVLEAGEGVQAFKPGDRVACIGAGYAQHTNYAVVPQNLCVPLPEGVSFAQGAYAHLSATSLNGLRRGQPEFGEFVAVLGLGVVGQLTAQLYQLAGNYVIGWDRIGFRLDVARTWGIHAAVNVDEQDPVAATAAFTAGQGLDAAVLAFGGDADQAVKTVEKCLKCAPDTHPMGRIVALGGPRFLYTSTLTNVDVRRASRTGPGYHDPAWESGADYPAVFVRWTSRDNVAVCIRLMAEGRLNVNCLTTHVISLPDVDAGISAIINDPDRILGVLFQMQH